MTNNFLHKISNHINKAYASLPDDNQPVWDPFLPDNSGPTSGQHSNSDKAHQVHTAASSAIARALSRAKERHNPGQEPSIFERLAESGMTPTVNWETHLQFCLTSSGHDDYNWARPNRRLRPHGFYLPSYRGFQIPKTLFVFDTSGSISSEFLGQMAAELNKLLSIARNSTITILSCDTEVHVIGEFSAVKPFKPKEHRLVGGGGTSFIEPFNYAVKHKFEQLIYMTDTEGSFPDKETVKTIWLVPEARKHAVPFGKTIVIPYFY